MSVVLRRQTPVIVIGESPDGVIDGINKTFTTQTSFMAGSTKVYFNGQRLKASNDYIEGAGTITLEVAPVTGDIIILDYLPA